jgi:flagellar capping protein FliD
LLLYQRADLSILQRKPDEQLVNIIVGDSASHGLTEFKVRLALVQAACLLSLEGTARATASLIAARASQEYGVNVTASFAGQTFSMLNIPSVTTHGKNHFVLNTDQLEKIREETASRCEQALEKLRECTEKFGDLPKRIQELQHEWRQILSLRSKEQELIKAINEDRRDPNRPDMALLESEYKKIQQRNQFIERVKEEGNALALREKRLPSLEARQQAIKDRVAQYERMTGVLLRKEVEAKAQEEQLAKKEAALNERLAKLQHRLGWIKLAELEQAINEANKELASLSKQLKEKRSLLDIFKRNKGGKR